MLNLSRCALCLMFALSAIPLDAADWPQWRGPRRDGVCDETGLLQQWPVAGPPLLWSFTNLGRGFSAPIVVQERIYITGDAGDELRIHALDLEGKPVWQAKNGRSWNGPYPGARASCTFNDGKLYHLNAHGRVVCLKADSGAELWSVNLVERFGAKVIHWGLSENLLVDGQRVIVTPGGSKALVVAFDKTTGETVWASEPLKLGVTNTASHERLSAGKTTVDSASYASPILIKVGGRRLIVNCSLQHVFGVDADTGELAWSRPLATRYQVIPMTPVQVGDAVFVTAPHSEGGKLYGLRSEGAAVRVEQRWRAGLDSCQGGAVHVNGVLYGAKYEPRDKWISLDAQTGKIRYELEDMARGSLIHADQRLYCLSEEGEVALLNPTAKEFEVAGRFRLVPERKSDAWTHPVVANGRLYLRYHDTLFCYDIRSK